MFVTSLQVKGFLRLAHNNINELTIDFTNIFQIILGRNGSGKSSLMGELTPYPSHKELYADDGYRRLCCNHRGHSYVILDDFNRGQAKHSIWKDEVLIHENLNPTMAKTVVKEIFGLDKMLVDILTDRIRFTTMSPVERRDIIMRASGINVELGLEMLEKIKERRSYFKEYSKNLSKRLVAEDNALPTTSHVEQLEKRKESILEDLSLLDEINQKSVDIEPERNVISKLRELESTWKSKVYRYLDTPEILHSAKEMDDIIEIGTRTKYKIEDIEKTKKALAEEIETIASTLGNARFSKTSEDLNKEIEFLKKERELLISNSKGFIFTDMYNYSNAVACSQPLYEELRSVFDNLFDNSDRYFNIKDKQVNTEQIINATNLVSVMNKAIDNIETQLALHKDGEEVQCPACKNSFIPGLTLSETSLKEKLKANLEILAKTTKSLNEYKEYDLGYNEYTNALTKIETLKKHFPIHKALFESLTAYNYIANSPKGCLQILEDWFNDIVKSTQYGEYSVRLDGTEQELYRIGLIDFERRKLDDEKLAKLEKKYSLLIDEQLKEKENLKAIKEYVFYIKDLEAFLKESGELVESIDLYKDDLLKNKIHSFVSSCKMDLNLELNNIEKEITSINYTIKNRASLIADKEKTDNDIELLNIIHDELSPKSGLLGDVMNEFIEKFVTQMNNFIKPVWTYDVKILPCRNKKGDLDYYFPISIMGGTPTSDVKFTSTGEGHICNFVFKLLIMSTYDLQDYPLFLDELAGNMDDVHRVRVMKTIYDMVMNNYCTQMFLIAHYQQQYGVFPQAEVLVINAENLQTIPEGYNTHAKFC